jgi:periodic tryptophan protein 2
MWIRADEMCVDGRAVLVNFKRSTVLHHFNFKKPVRDVKFSPDGK